MLSTFTFLDEDRAPLGIRVDSAIHAIVESYEPLVALELGPIAFEQVFTGVEVDAEIMKILAVKDLFDVRAADDIHLMVSPAFEFLEFVGVSICTSGEEAVERSHHVVT